MATSSCPPRTGARGPRSIHEPGRVPGTAPGTLCVPAGGRLCAHAARARAGDGALQRFVPGILFTLLLIVATVAALYLLGVTDWRCYPIALLYPFTLEAFEYGAIGPVLLLLTALVLALSRHHWRHCSGNGRRGRAEALRLAAALVARVHRPSPRGRGRRRHRARAGARLVERARVRRHRQLPAAARQARRGRGRELVLGVRHLPRARASGDGVEARCDRRGRCTARARVASGYVIRSRLDRARPPLAQSRRRRQPRSS